MYGGRQTNLHLDILMGRDEVIEPSDIFLGDDHSVISCLSTHFSSRDGDWPFAWPSQRNAKEKS